MTADAVQTAVMQCLAGRGADCHHAGVRRRDGLRAGSSAGGGGGAMTDMDPNKTGWLLKYRRTQNAKLREQISKEITSMSLSDLRTVLRMIEQWKAGK